MNYWSAVLSDGTEVKETDFAGKKSPWSQFQDLLVQKPGVKILDISIIVNGRTYVLPSSNSKSMNFKGDFIQGYRISRRIRQDICFSSGESEFFIMGFWVDVNNMLHSIAINTMTNDVVLYIEKNN